VLGLAIGMLGAVMLRRVLSSMIFGVSTRDIATYASVSILLVSAALVASVIPAWRATKVDPMRSLRDE
jgi:ABC-type antimicrobial peptide transport system permease subunit